MVVAVACLTVGLLAPVTASAGEVRRAGSAPRTMLVFLRPSVLGRSPARSRAVVRSRQAAVAALGASLGARILSRTSVPDELTMRLTPSQARSLASSDLVERVLPNSLVPGPPEPSAALGTDITRGAPAHGPCGTAAAPQLNPEGLANVDAVGAERDGYDGAGVKVALLADGLDPKNADLQRNAAFASASSAAGTPVVSSDEDFSGAGTSAGTDGAEAFGDAASIAAQGNKVYDLSSLVGTAHPLHKGCDIRIEGDAPGASLLALDVFGSGDVAPATAIVEAVNFAVSRGAKVINESFGFNDFPSTSVDIVRAADAAAVAAGVTVVVSSGDAGVDSTIGSPASDPSVLTVGATTTYRAYAQLTFGGINALGSTAGYLDNNISSLSSGGFAQDGKTVNLVAPGDLGWSLCSTSDKFFGCSGRSVQLFGGTSESAPLTSGAAADVIGAYEATHAGSVPTPQLVMRILTSTAKDVAAPADQQGAGLLDVGAAVRLATSIAGTTASSPPGGVLSDTSQLDLSGAPSSIQSAVVGLTNTGTTAQSVQLATRAMVPVATTAGTVVLNPSQATKEPTFVGEGGVRDVYQETTFPVADGIARVELQAAFSASDFLPLNVSLFAPDGDLAGYSLPQGPGNFADVEVATPAAGTWTAVFFTVQDVNGIDGGAKGEVHWSESDWNFSPEGSVTPDSLTLAPGEERDVTVQVTCPTAPGDSDFAVVLVAGAQQTTIPVALRTMVAIGSTGGAFEGELTGGNGRFGAPGQTNTYSLTVPSGERDLDVGLAMAANPLRNGIVDTVLARLVDPYGNVRALDTNDLIPPMHGAPDTRFVNLYVADPAAGDWELVLEWLQPGAGARTSIPFTGSVEFNEVSVSDTLPDAATTKVPVAGARFTVTVHDAGVAPMELFPDARTEGLRTTVLTESGSPIDEFAEYYVPTQATSVEFVQTSSRAATFEAELGGGDPVLSPALSAPYLTGTHSSLRATATYAPPGGVPSGFWSFLSSEIGPFGAAKSKTYTVTQSVRVTARAFDASVTTPVSDEIEELFTIKGGGKFVPRYVAAGSSTALVVTIHPTAKPGTVVAGTLYLMSAPQDAFYTNTLAAIPYTYVVG